MFEMRDGKVVFVKRSGLSVETVYHVAALYDGTALSSYINGQKVRA